MDIKQIRRENLIALVENFRSLREFADATDSTPAHISHMKNGVREMGDSVARRIETSLEMPYGWMDAAHSFEENKQTFEGNPKIGHYEFRDLDVRHLVESKRALPPKDISLVKHHASYITRSETHAEISRRIRQAREAKQLTIEALASMTPHLSTGNIKTLERGYKLPEPWQSKELAEALGVSAAYLMCLEDEPNEEKKYFPRPYEGMPPLDESTGAPSGSMGIGSYTEEDFYGSVASRDEDRHLPDENQPEAGRHLSPQEETLLDSFILVPKYDVQASMGNGNLVTSEQVVDHLAFKRTWIKNEVGVSPENLALITAIGDSMAPTLHPGDLLLIDTSVKEIRGDAIYIIAMRGELLAKRVQLLFDGSLEIMSDNPAYKTQTITPEQAEQLRIVGRVVWAGRRM